MLRSSCDRRQEGTSFAHAAAEERTRTVAILAVLRLQPLETAEDLLRTDRVAPREKAARIVDPLRHRELDIAFRRNAEIHGVDGLVDEHGEHAIDDRGAAGAILRGSRCERAGTIVVVAALA